MELKEAIERLKDNLKMEYGDNTLVNREDLSAVLNELDNRIPKEILEKYLTQAEERYKTYKKASEENEGCKGGMWKYLGQVDLLKRILGKSINVVTLDKE